MLLVIKKIFYVIQIAKAEEMVNSVVWVPKRGHGKVCWGIREEPHKVVLEVSRS